MPVGDVIAGPAVTGLWTDLRVPGISGVGGAGVSPTFAQIGSTGIYAMRFSATVVNRMHFAAQLPHSYMPGTEIRPHLHWMPDGTDTGNALWEMDYLWLNMGEAVGSEATLQVLAAGNGNNLEHQVGGFSTIAKTNAMPSSMLIFSIARLGNDGTDTLTDPAFLLEMDFHYQQGPAGSVAEFPA